jgi:hypothetical protein
MAETTPADSGMLGRYERPDRLDTLVIVTTVALVAAYLPLLVYRATTHGFGDAQVYFRAAWAVWSGYPLYQVTDMHGWSYHYPPTFAILIGPFADPMPGHPPPAFALPFAWSIAVWYLISVAAAAWAAHIFAGALERFSGVRIGGSRSGWWGLRAAPVLLLTPYLGSSFARGQPTTILVLLVAAFLSLYAGRRPVGAAAALSLAIAIKMFPAALLVIPLLRRDFRFLLYTVLWSAFFLFALPALLLGIDQTIELYSSLWAERLAGIAEGAPSARVEAEISPWQPDMVAFGAMLARTFTDPAADAPYRLPEWAQIVQLAFDFVILGLIVALGRGKFWQWSSTQPDRPYAILVAGAVLFAALPAMLPVAQHHYWAHVQPLFALLIVEHWRRAGVAKPVWWLVAWGAAAIFAYIATGVSLWQPLREHGPSTLVMLFLVAAGFLVLWRRGATKPERRSLRPAPTAA